MFSPQTPGDDLRRPAQLQPLDHRVTQSTIAQPRPLTVGLRPALRRQAVGALRQVTVPGRGRVPLQLPADRRPAWAQLFGDPRGADALSAKVLDHGPFMAANMRVGHRLGSGR